MSELFLIFLIFFCFGVRLKVAAQYAIALAVLFILIAACVDIDFSAMNEEEISMNDRIDERKVNKYLYEIAGRASTICGHSKLWHEPEYTMAQWLYLTLSDTELESRLEPTLENITHQSGSVIQWGPYCGMDERAYKREYLKSDEWKRKRDVVMQRAMQSFMPAFPDIRHTVDRYGRVIKWIANVEHRPICEKDGCTNEATDVHHLTYERIGKERLDDLQALCRKCHEQQHK